MVLEGGYISPGMNLYRIADLSHLWILADVYEYEVPLVRIGQEARVTLPYSAGAALKATVSYIYPVLDPNTRTVKVRLVVTNPGLDIKPEMFANVEILTGSGARLAIPREAVLESGLRQIVYVEKEAGHLRDARSDPGPARRGLCRGREGRQEGRARGHVRQLPDRLREPAPRRSAGGEGRGEPIGND